MRKTLLVACFLATTAVMPALAAGEMSKKLTAEAYTDLQTTITGYIDSTTVDTETFEDGAVVNITPLLDQINGAFTGHEYTSEDRDASNKKRPAYVTEDQFKEIAKTLDSQFKGYSGGGSVNVGLVRQAVTTTLTQAQASTQMSNATEVRASERAAIKAYVAAMKASGQSQKMSAGGALAWGPSHGYPIVAPKYYTPAQISDRFTGTAKPAGSGNTGTVGTGTATGTGNTGAGNTGTVGTGTGNTGTVGTGTGGTGSAGTGTGSTGTVGSGSSGSGTPGMGTGTGATGTGGTGTGVGSGTGSAGTGTGSTGAGTTQGGTLVLPNPTDLGTAIGNTGGTGTGTTGTSTGGSTGAPVTTGMSSNGTSTNTPDGAVPGGLTTDPSRTTPNNTPTNVTTVVQPQPTPTTTNQTPIDPTLNPTLLSPGQELGANDVPRNIGQSVGSALNSAAAALQ